MLFRSNDTAPTEIYTPRHTLSLHDALPISACRRRLELPRRWPPRRSGTCARRSVGRGAKAQRPTAAVARVALLCAGRPAGARRPRPAPARLCAPRAAHCHLPQRAAAEGPGGRGQAGLGGSRAGVHRAPRTGAPLVRHGATTHASRPRQAKCEPINQCQQ